MSRRISAGALPLVALVALTACGVSAEGEPRALPPEAAGALLSPQPVETDSAATRFMALWFVKDGALVQVDRRTDEAVDSREKLAALEAGPTQSELDFGLRTAVTSVVPDEPLLVVAAPEDLAVPLASDQVAVMLNPEFFNLPSQEQQLVLGQVVLTLASGGVRSVLFVDDSGAPVGVALPDGRLVNRAVSPRDYRSLQA